MLKEFREFIERGNVIELAVAFILGLAFNAIVKSLVNDMIMPVAGLITGGADFTNRFIVMGSGSFDTLAAAQEAGVATLNYGVFINTVIEFIIIAFVLFMMVRTYNRFRRKQEEAPAKPPAPPRQEVLLEEIRDALRSPANCSAVSANRKGEPRLPSFHGSGVPTLKTPFVGGRSLLLALRPFLRRLGQASLSVRRTASFQRAILRSRRSESQPGSNRRSSCQRWAKSA